MLYRSKAPKTPLSFSAKDRILLPRKIEDTDSFQVSKTEIFIEPIFAQKIFKMITQFFFFVL